MCDTFIISYKLYVMYRQPYYVTKEEFSFQNIGKNNKGTLHLHFTFYQFEILQHSPFVDHYSQCLSGEEPRECRREDTIISLSIILSSSTDNICV